jgi:hypothetical protein
MSAPNFACETVQRSGGSNPSYLYAPSVSEGVETGNPENLDAVTVASGTDYDVSGTEAAALFPTQGIYSLIADSVGVADLSAVGRVLISSTGVRSFIGFQAATSLAGAGFATFAQMLCAGGGASTAITLQQNSGAAINYVLYATKLAN